MTAAVRVLIEGRVQGVGFRYWMIERAGGLGLDGWVRNRRDGAVEAVFAGPADAVAAMLRHCHDGPAFARVTRVHEQPETGPVEAGFNALPTA